MDNRGRTETQQVPLQYAVDSPIQVEKEVVLDPSGTTEAVLFLRGPVNGEVKGPQVFRLLWNHTETAVINEPNYKKLFSRWTQLRGQMEQAAAKRVPQAEMDALKKKRGELEKEMNAWQGPAYIYNPAMDIDKLPGSRSNRSRSKGRSRRNGRRRAIKTLFFAGDKRQEIAYARGDFHEVPAARVSPAGRQGRDRGDRLCREGVPGRPASCRSPRRCGSACSECCVPRAFSSWRSRPVASTKTPTAHRLRTGIAAVVFPLEHDAGRGTVRSRGCREAAPAEHGCRPGSPHARRSESGPAGEELRRPMAVGARLRFGAAGRRLQELRQGPGAGLETGALRVLRRGAAQGPADHVVPRQRFRGHQRTARQALRHRGSRRAGVPAGGDQARASSRRRAGAWPA